MQDRFSASAKSAFTRRVSGRLPRAERSAIDIKCGIAPYEAARKALGVEITLRGDAEKRIRVVEVTDSRQRDCVPEFEFTRSG